MNEKLNENNQELIILGVHRSGTSLLTRIINLCGAYLGEEEELMLGNPNDNPKGHWENKFIVNINDKILNYFGGSWDQPPQFPDFWWNWDGLNDIKKEIQFLIYELKKNAPNIAIKDPRMCLTLPLWKKYLCNAKFIILARNSYENISSLKKRNDFPQIKNFNIYTSYWTNIIENTNNEKRLFVSFDNLLTLLHK